MATKLFLYCPDTVSAAVRTKFSHKGYEMKALTNDTAEFWNAITSVDVNGVLVLYSHGDANGPLMVRGTVGDDMTASQILTFSALMVLSNIKLYMLSCNTGAGAFAQALTGHQVAFVAPQGYAAVGANTESLSVKSVANLDGSGTAGWVACELKAPRTGGTLYLP